MERRCLVVAEVAQAHDGSLGTAHAFIDACARRGVDLVKFQMHLAAEESTPSEPWRVKFSKQDASRYDYWRRMEFTFSQWQELKAHCDEAGVGFLCSPFSLEAVERLKRIGMPAWKVASGEVMNREMIDAMSETGWPIWASTGMIGWQAIDGLVAQLRMRDLPTVLFQCTTAYPTPPESVGLNVLAEMRERYGVEVGLSDHSGAPYAGLAAATLGASVLEVHATLHREAFGPDVVASLDLDQLEFLVQGVRAIESMIAHPVDKDAMAEQTAPMRALFQKSVVLREAQPAGTVLTAAHLIAKKPGTGIPASELTSCIGRTLRRAMEADSLLQFSDFEPESLEMAA